MEEEPEPVPPRAMTMLDIPKFDAKSKYNDSPGTGRTGLYNIPPNNYDFYTEEEKYIVRTTAGGGILSSWEPKYEPSTVQEDADRIAAHDAGVPVGSDGTAKTNSKRTLAEQYPNCPVLKLLVVSELHSDEEYGGPFWIEVPSKTRVWQLRRVLYEKCGVLPGLLRLAYAGKRFEDAERNLEHYGVKYWNAKFPDWPIIIKRH